MEQVRPSPIALASLAQLQASGVNDSDLLDKMLERGEDWLDHTLQLLRHCEELDVIGGNYTQWCENALEDAYDWIESVNERENILVAEDTQSKVDAATEEQFLQKLMSEEPIAEGRSVVPQEETDELPQAGEEVQQEVPPSSSTALVVQKARPMLPRRQGGSRHLLRRVLASFWHG